MDGPPFAQEGSGPATCCKDSIGYHGSFQMPSLTRGAYHAGPRGAVLNQRGENARAAGKEMTRLVKEAALEERQRAGAGEEIKRISPSNSLDNTLFE